MRIEGTIFWCKLDKAWDNYNKKNKIMNKETGQPDGWGQEWTVTLGRLTKDTKLALRDAGLLDKVKNKMDDQEDFITFRLATAKKDGTVNDPIRIVNAATGTDWDWKEDGKIGNESKGVMAFNIWKQNNGKKSIYPVSLLVTEHVPYESDEDDSGGYEDPNDWSEFIKPAAAAKAKPATKAKTKVDLDVELDDDIPF